MMKLKKLFLLEKKYGVYTKEDNIIVQEIKYYFMEIHFLLKELDNL